MESAGGSGDIVPRLKWRARGVPRRGIGGHRPPFKVQSAGSPKLFRCSAIAAAGLAFILAILGSWVRINGAGMTCPDWPLCHGALIPVLRGGVVLEWSHRTVAILDGLLIVVAFYAGWRRRTKVVGVGRTLVVLAVIFILQVALGGLTVHEANSPASVTLHWVMAMALLTALTTLAILSVAGRPPLGELPAGLQHAPAAPALVPLVVAAGLAFVTMGIGAYVSSSFAGLACSSVPFCGTTLIGATGPQVVQMLHRVSGGLFALAAIFATARAIRTANARAAAAAIAGSVLMLGQVALGMANVAWALPVPLREAHAANASLTFLAYVTAAALAAIDPIGHSAPSGQRLESAPVMERRPQIVRTS